MRSADWKALGSFGIILGVLLILGGLIAYSYTETRWIFEVAPYRDMAAPLMIAGIFLLVLGYTGNQRAREELRLENLPKPPSPIPPSSTQKRFCESCGTELSSTAKYCPRCGQQIKNQ
jgi:uncharacterized paraquat-inducible protein A